MQAKKQRSWKGLAKEKLLYFNARTKRWFLKIPIGPQYLVKLTSMFEDKNFPKEQNIAHGKLETPSIAANRHP